MRVSIPALSAAVAGVFTFAGTAGAQVIFDTFDVDSSANYTEVIDNSGFRDGVTVFAYDYSADGIPAAPNSLGGTTLGLKLSANDTDNLTPAQEGEGLTEDETVTLYNNTPVGLSSYIMSVDVFFNVEDGVGGSTEHMHAGIAGDGSTLNSIFTPISGSGHFLAFTPDGGSTSDYRHRVPAGIRNTGDPSYLNSDNTTQATGDTYQAIFPEGEAQFPGSPGNLWTTLTITADSEAGLITYAFDGTPIIQDTYDPSDGDLVSLGLGDLFAGSMDGGEHFVIFDNLSVTVIPEPASLSLLGVGTLAMLRRRRA